MRPLVDHWYGNSALAAALRPVSWLYRLLVAARRAVYALGIRRVARFNVPVIVVGNITVGGTGKTPLVIWLANRLRREGYSPGIVARGYRGAARHWPQQVRPDSDPVMVGDEAVVLARRCGCPVSVGPDRVAAVDAMLEYHDCDVIISDDGLQHYALGRDLEIVVIDGVRRFGNGYCLPAGPLREPVGRVRSVDFVAVNGGSALRREYPMQLQVVGLRNVRNERLSCRVEEFPHRQVHAVAGIGHPERFFQHMRQLGFSAVEHAFADHHEFTAADLVFEDERPVVMTEKDAVKCRRFCGDNCWYLAIEARPDERMEARLLKRVGELAGVGDPAAPAATEQGD